MFVLSKKRRKKKIFDQLNPTSVCVCVCVCTQKNNKKFEIVRFFGFANKI